MPSPKLRFHFRPLPLAIASAILLLARPVATAAPTAVFDESPVRLSKLDNGNWLADFGKVSFANLEVDPAGHTPQSTVFHFGEASKNGRVDRKPPGSVRYARVEASLQTDHPVRIAPPTDPRNTKQPAAILTPPEFGVILPFRWVEIENWNGELKPDQLTRKSVWLASWDDHAAEFESSNQTLNDIWELCRYSIKATTFAGVYVDGDRERIPYEADAYINQLCHYATDTDLQTSRDTFDRLMDHPTWPSEWAPHMVFIAHADWMHTGNADWLKPRYQRLKSKLLAERVGDHGLVQSNQKQRRWNDIVDWPRGERDGFVHTRLNTVVNAFHLAALEKMADLALAVGKPAEARQYRSDRQTRLAEFNRRFFIKSKSAYRDGEGTDHTSLHASLFPLAFGLVPDGHAPDVADFVAGRGMRCSVYAAQYQMEGLFRTDRDRQAVDLILAQGDRSWKHMLDSGTTITWEAWDQKYKSNQDWNHAWGAAPANLLPRFILGAEPVTPGWKKIRIQPRTSGLDHARGTIPTPLGPVKIQWRKSAGSLDLTFELPDGMEAELVLPQTTPESSAWLNQRQAAASRANSWLTLTQPLRGSQRVIVR
ncbi:MAG: alpha-L-rhamnosidase C-terminal domain-containing protein [Verrucomicrobiota bacterium JB025]|nr:alpha-L-rhamnosidase C-terminal domain-containing protein [Verrucomicrobiota bacterium JB025]